MNVDFFTTECWKKTALGTPIALFASDELPKLIGRRPILIMGGIHGDEPEGVQLAQDTLTWLKKVTSPRGETANFHSSEVVPWILIPCLNVDGFAQGTRVNGRGVDLNRNYPSRDWSPTYEKDRYFPGPAAGSEPEIQGVVELIEIQQPRLLIHCHSWEPCIVGTGSVAQPDAERLARSSGYKAVEEIGYPTPGSLSRYGWHDRKIPVICIEEQEGQTDLASIWPRFANGMKEIFTDLSDRHSIRQDGP